MESTRFNLSAELTELLHRLYLSPSVLLEDDARAIDQNSSSLSGRSSIRNADSGLGYPDQFNMVKHTNRNALLRELEHVIAEGKICILHNGFFHEQLVNHFERKQMMRVYGEPYETDPLKSKYLKKLSKYEQIRQELQAAEEDFNVEINLLRDALSKKVADMDSAVEELVSKQRLAGSQAYANGKQFPAKEIQVLITRELGKMKDISEVRVRYTRLRDTLVEKEVISDAVNSLTPNLERKDYERLEAENFHYKHELRMKEKEADYLAKRQDHLSRQVKRIRHKRYNLSRAIQKRRESLKELKWKIAEIYKKQRVRKQMMKEATKYFEKFATILELRLCPELQAEVTHCRVQHKQLFKKVNALVKKIQAKEQYMISLRQPKILDNPIVVTDDEDTDVTLLCPQKPRRPPLGGGFLQAL